MSVLTVVVGRVLGMGDPVEASASWLMAVIEQRGERIPLVAIQPDVAEHYEHARTRLVKAGFGRLSLAEWERAAWPWSPTTAVDVAQGKLIRFTNGTTSFYCGTAQEVGPQWLQAGVERGRALVMLLPSGWVSPEDAEKLSERPELLPERAGEAAAQRKLLAATGGFRVDLVRLTGPGWRQAR